MKQTKIECNKCNRIIPSNPSVVRLFNIKMEFDNKYFVLKALVCPYCKSRYPIRIDNTHTGGLVRQLQKLRTTLDNRTTNEKVLLRFKQVQSELKEADRLLFESYDRSFYQDADLKERLELRLPVTKTGGEESNGKRSEQNI